MCGTNKTPKGYARFLRRLHGQHYAIVTTEKGPQAVACTCKKLAHMTSKTVVFAASPQLALQLAHAT